MSHVYINPLRGMAIALIAIVMPLSFLLSCTGEKKDLIEVIFDPQTTYTLKKENVKAYISDSGITRYKIETATWLIFDRAAEPYWYFPDGAYLENFDTLFNVEASIKADTAYYYEKKKLWEAIGNVDISNLNGERFQTSQIFWNQDNNTIYSDSFIRITKGESVNTGIGFISNADLSKYEIYNAKADIPFEMQRNSTVGDTLPQDISRDEILPDTIIKNNPDSILSDNNSHADMQD